MLKMFNEVSGQPVLPFTVHARPMEPSVIFACCREVVDSMPFGFQRSHHLPLAADVAPGTCYVNFSHFLKMLDTHNISDPTQAIMTAA